MEIGDVGFNLKIFFSFIYLFILKKNIKLSFFEWIKKKKKNLHSFENVEAVVLSIDRLYEQHVPSGVFHTLVDWIGSRG